MAGRCVLETKDGGVVDLRPEEDVLTGGTFLRRTTGKRKWAVRRYRYVPYIPKGALLFHEDDDYLVMDFLNGTWQVAHRCEHGAFCCIGSYVPITKWLPDNRLCLAVVTEYGTMHSSPTEYTEARFPKGYDKDGKVVT